MKLFRILLALVLVVLIGLAFLWIKVPDLVAKQLSKQMQVEVKIGDIALSAHSIGVKNLEIGNPKNSILPKAYSAGSIEVKASLSNYLKDPIVIDELQINQIYVGLEFASPISPSGNWSTILENMKKSAPVSKKKEARSVLIKKLILTDIRSDLIFTQQGGKVQNLLPIDRLELNNVSSEAGVSLDQIARVILEQTLNALLKKQSLQSMIENVIQSPTGTWEKFKELIPK